MTALHLLGMLSTNFSKSELVITWNQECMIASMSSFRFPGLFAATWRLSLAHKFSMGLRSGLFPGQFITLMLLLVNQSTHFLAVWQGAPSCWNIKSWPCPKISLAEGSILGINTWLIYLSAFMFPSNTCNLPTEVLFIHPHTITRRGCLVVGVRQSGK